VTGIIVSALPAVVNLKIYAGDDFDLDVTVTNEDGSAADLTGYTASATVRPSVLAPQAAVFQATITANVIHLHLSNTDTAGLDGAMVWDCQVAKADLSDVVTLAAGQLRAAAQVTP
jgi:hypothetical protein